MKCLKIAFFSFALFIVSSITSSVSAQADLDSLKISIAQHTQVVVNGGYTNCHSIMVGSHPDPKGNGRDSDYIYKFTVSSSTPPAWTGDNIDIPGERITFMAGYSTKSSPTPIFDGCDNFAKHAAAFAGIELWVHFTVEPNKKPIATFTHTESEELLEINFDASDSEDEDGEVVSYSWDFDGDGVSDSNAGPITKHKFEKRGTYKVQLIVTDDEGDDSNPFTADVTVEGPELEFTATVKKYSAAQEQQPPFKIGDDGEGNEEEGDEFHIGDTLVVHIAIENIGEVPLEDVSLTAGLDDIEVTADEDETLSMIEALKESIERLDPAATDTISFLFRAGHEQEDVLIWVKSISGLIVHDSVDDELYTVDITSCAVEKISGEEDSEGCISLTILPAPVVVNSTGDDPLLGGLSEEDGCTTGGSIMRDGESEPECTLRAAMERAALRDSDLPLKIEIDIPGGGEQHVIELEGSALPVVSSVVQILGLTQPAGNVAVDGSGMQAGGAALSLHGEGSLVEGLAFYGFPGTVLDIRADGATLRSSRIGTDWFDGHASTDVAQSLSFRNGGAAVRVTGDDVTIGGVGEEGNVIVGSEYGVLAEGALALQVLGNTVGDLDAPHTEDGIHLAGSSGVQVGSSDAPNTISFNLGHGIRADASSADGLSVVGNAGSGIVALADGVVVGGPNDIELFDCKGACNIIAGNGADGIRNYAEERYSTLSSGMGSDTKSAGEGGSGGMVVQGNFIGTGLDIAGGGNAGHGVSLGALGAGNTVGGAVTGQGNLISGNGGSGVVVMASTRSVYFKGTQWEGGKGNSVRGNRIVNNARPAIDLYPNYILSGGDGWSPLSTEDLSYGPNRMINWPYIVESSQGFSFNDILVFWRGPAGAGRVNLYIDVYTSA